CCIGPRRGPTRWRPTPVHPIASKSNCPRRRNAEGPSSLRLVSRGSASHEVWGVEGRHGWRLAVEALDLHQAALRGTALRQARCRYIAGQHIGVAMLVEAAGHARFEWIPPGAGRQLDDSW